MNDHATGLGHLDAAGQTRTTASCRQCGRPVRGRRRNGFCGDKCRMQRRRMERADRCRELLATLEEGLHQLRRMLKGE